MRWAAFKYEPVLLVHLVIIFICRKLTVLCMEAAGITKFAATSQPYDPQ